jgi:hypothetical protein
VLALGFASIAKSRLLCRIARRAVSGWRWDLAWATAAGSRRRGCSLFAAGMAAESVGGIPAILVAFGAVLWTKGFGPRTASCSG